MIETEGLACPTPSNISGIQTVNFSLAIDRLPNLAFFCQKAQIPEVALPNAEVETSLSKVVLEGDKLKYSPLNVTFMVSSNMANYNAIFNWLVGAGFPQTNEQFNNYVTKYQEKNMGSESSLKSTGHLGIYNGSYELIQLFSFYNLFPTNLHIDTFDTTDENATYLTASATFKYQYFDFKQNF